MVTSLDAACANWPTGRVVVGEADKSLRAPPSWCLSLRDSSGSMVMNLDLDRRLIMLGFAIANLSICALHHSSAGTYILLQDIWNYFSK